MWCQALAVADDRTISQWQHTAWSAREGAPPGINCLSQSSDGYLWLGTSDGLFRFDGVRFERYEPERGSTFPAHDVRAILSLPNGELWIGFASGVISLLKEGIATNYTRREGVPGWVNTLAQDRDGVLWAATRSGLARFEGNRWKVVGADWNYPAAYAYGLFLDRSGTIWVATHNTVLYLLLGANKFQSTGINADQVVQFAEAPNGKLWMAQTTRSVRPIPIGVQLPSLDNTEIQVGSAGILFDREGAFWITSLGDGLRRAPDAERLQGKVAEFGSAVQSFTARDGLTDDYAIPVIQDLEGNIWVGTSNGIDRFRKSNFVPIAASMAASSSILAAGNAGDVWACTPGTSKIVRTDGVHQYSIQTPIGHCISSYRGPDGVNWWVADNGVYRVQADRVSRYPFPGGLPVPLDRDIVVAGDSSDVLWAAVERLGFFFMRNGAWYRYDTREDVAKLKPLTAFTDWTGRIWFGYSGGAVVTLDNQTVQSVSSESDSLVGSVKVIQGRDPHVWIGGERGLALYDGGRFQLVAPEGQASFMNISGIQETARGDLWLSERHGVLHIAGSEVKKFINDFSYRVKYETFDSLDGLPGTFIGGAMPLARTMASTKPPMITAISKSSIIVLRGQHFESRH